MKILFLTILVGVTQSVWAAIGDNISGNFTVASNYTERGVSRHKDNRAMYGTLNYVSENGLYAGVWLGHYKPLWSNEPDTETDLYVGFNHEFKFGNNIDTSFWHGSYVENTERDYDWNEWQVSYHYHDRWGFTFALADNLYGSDDHSAFIEVSFAHQTELLTIFVSLGRQQFDSRHLSDVTYLHTRVSLDWRNWHLFLENSFTHLESDSAFFSKDWDTNPSGIGLAFTF
jgi:uncharacterized protein (TIGR02001 family)